MAIRVPNRKEFNDKVLDLRKDAEDYCSPYWDKIKFNRQVYNNDNPHTHDKRNGFGTVKAFLRGKSIYNQTAITVDTVTPWLAQGIPRATFQADQANPKQSHIVDLPELIETAERWFRMYEEVDSEGDLHALMCHNVTIDGLAVRGVGWHRYQDRLISPVISALSFMVDSGCSKIDLSDAFMVGIKDLQPSFLVKSKNPNAELDKNKSLHRVDELWVRKEIANEFLKIKADKMVRIVLVDDKVVQGSPHHTMWAYPDFPFVCWRNFLYTDPESLKPSEFWGVGYPEKLWRQQKVLDQSIAEFLLQLGNISSGKLLVKNGAIIDDEALLPRQGLVIHLEEGFEPLTDLKELPPEQIDTVLFQWITWLIDAMQRTTGTGEVFSGEAPFSGASGRAIAALQSMAFTHISNLIRSMIGYRMRQARIKFAIMQQKARLPVEKNLWRQGIDLKGEFPEDARHIGVNIQIHDTSELPQTPAGKLQAIMELANNGYILSPEKFLELSGFDKGYGITPDDFLQNIQTQARGNGNNGNAGFETVMDRLTPDQV